MLLDRVRTLASQGARATRAVLDVGVLRPVRPDRLARLPLQYLRFGPVPATVGAMAALRFPDRIALYDEKGHLTYAELERRAAALATVLAGRVGDGGRVGVLCRNHRGFVEAVLAASRLGHDVVLLNTDFSGAQLGEVAGRENVGLLLHDQEFDEVVDDASFGGQRVHMWRDRDEGKHPSADELVEGVTPEPRRPARAGRTIIMTSGTTGTPKGAQHDIGLGALLPAAVSHLMRVPVRSGAPVVIAPPLFHVLGFAYLAVGIGLGMPLVLARRFDPAGALKAIEEHRAETLIAVPVMLQRMLDVPDGPRPSALRVVVCGGSALHPHLSERFMDEFGDVLHNVYGATETGWATISTPEDLRAAPGTVGRPSFRLTIRILDEDGDELPPGETGEIYTGGGLKFAGYTGGGSKKVRDGLTGTGDLGHFDEQGRLFVDGRADDMIVSGGENVFPGEVEDLLGEHEAIAEVTVTGVEDERFGQRLAAHVVLKEGHRLTEDDVRAYVKRNLARYKVPRDVHFVDELPRTSTGKVRRKALRS
ncbi:acyl-CoA ligase FadD12 [Actinomadura kijaniata]|uniref:Fatty-acyl-CoA synthase n=1 Tax=Actinomadura namibiensis TaxID=182080 RepID=A0A7W3LIL1_ACTNM|nr:AMP-binding protein [Actinomadura namibiensis]MBA8948844.1 fatty-acyl-CoA synthase [Actinomadura namibiensis]